MKAGWARKPLAATIDAHDVCISMGAGPARRLAHPLVESPPYRHPALPLHGSDTCGHPVLQTAQGASAHFGSLHAPPSEGRVFNYSICGRLQFGPCFPLLCCPKSLAARLPAPEPVVDGVTVVCDVVKPVGAAAPLCPALWVELGWTQAPTTFCLAPQRAHACTPFYNVFQKVPVTTFRGRVGCGDVGVWEVP